MRCIVILSFIISYCIAVDRSNFKTCEQSSFCKRHRTETEHAPFSVMANTIFVSGPTLQMDIATSDSSPKFRVTLTTLQKQTIRVRVVEVDPLKDRYEPPVGDALVQEPVTVPMSEVKQTASMRSFSFADCDIEILLKPLRIDVYTKDNRTPLMSLNSKSLLKFEHTRTKPEHVPVEHAEENVDQQAANAGENPEEVQGEEHDTPADGEHDQEEEAKPHENQDNPHPDVVEGEWQETFKSHEDTKPNGPQSIGMDFIFPGFEHAYGIPEHADSFKLKSTKSTDPYRLYNLDVFEYELHNPMALYGSIPFMVMHNTERTMGLLWLNAAETWVDIRSTQADKSMFSNIVDYMKGGNELPQLETHWFSETGVIDVFLLLGEPKTPASLFSAYKSLTGSMPRPPLFAIAHHQCRWNYNDESDVYEVNENFDKYDIPMDVLWLDIEHTDGKRYFTWDGVKFPDSTKMIDTLAAEGRRMVTIIDPHIKRDSGYFVHDAATSQGHYVKDKNNQDYDGWCWPGSSSWLDFTSPAVRKFWADTLQPESYKGSTLDLFTWNDMNEPSVFNGPEITMHKDAIHYEGREHRDVHNIYGMYQQRATAEGQIQRSGKRPFVLSRAFFVGTQRYGAIWTGDNKADWEHLKISLPMLLSLNIAGIVLSGADVGGFFGNPEPELMMRWYQAAAFQPFYRAHAHIDTKRREPWLTPEPTRLLIRNAIRRRYALLPYWYTLFYESEMTGLPVMRPTWLEFPAESQYFDVEDQYFAGSALLVHPVTSQGATSVQVRFPGAEEVYYDIDTLESIAGNSVQTISLARPSKIPVFHRGGYIISRKMRVRRSSTLMKDDPYTITVALDINGKSSSELYIDDYESFDYKNGDYILRKFEFNNNVFTSSNLNQNSSYKSKSWVEKMIILGLKQRPSNVVLHSQGKQVNLISTYDENKSSLVIRKPAVNIADNFKIVIS